MPGESTWTRLISFLFTLRILDNFRKKERQPAQIQSDLSSRHRIENGSCITDWGTRDVLVGSLKNREQLQICIAHNFYHIPKAVLGNTDTTIRYIALYQSRHLFGQNAGIRYYGEVSGCQIVSRREITEIPSSRDDLYIRYEITEWKKLSNPIGIKESGGTVIFTNMFLLQNSREVPQLSLESIDDFHLYCFLLENREGTEIAYKNATTICKKGNYFVVADHRIVLSFAYEEFHRKPGHVIYKIKKSLNYI